MCSSDMSLWSDLLCVGMTEFSASSAPQPESTPGNYYTLHRDLVIMEYIFYVWVALPSSPNILCVQEVVIYSM